jgi:hypothetical protein
MSGNTSATGGYIIDVPPPPPTGEEITSALQIMVATLTGLPGNLVRPRWQPMPPVQPDATVTWASIGVVSVEADDYPYLKHDGAAQLVGAPGPGVDRMTRHSTLTVIATFYGPNAETCAGAMRDGLYVQQNWEPLTGVSLKLRGIYDLARAPELINQQWIDRFDIRMELRHQIDRIYPVLNLDGADVNIRQDNGAPDTLVTVREDTELRP